MGSHLKGLLFTGLPVTASNNRRRAAFYLALGLLSIFSGSVRAARDDEFDAALLRARSLNHLIALVLLGDGGTDDAWLREQLRRPEWVESLRPHSQIVVRADKSPSLVARFGATTFPQYIVIDGEGREVGRLQGKQPVEVLARRFRSIIEAVERFQKSDLALRENPVDAEALYWVGKYRWNRGDRSLAVDCFQKALTAGCQSRGDLQKSRTFDQELKAAALRHIAQHSLDCGNYARAEACFRQAFSSSQEEENLGRSALGLSMSLWRLGQSTEALGVLEKCWSSHPGSPVADQVLFTLGYVNHELGQNDSASRYFQLLSERYPQSLYGQRAKRYLRRN